jgi:hypothetical protein
MNIKPLNKAMQEDILKADTALQRAAKKALELARQTQTPLVIMRNGKICREIPAKEINKSE